MVTISLWYYNDNSIVLEVVFLYSYDSLNKILKNQGFEISEQVRTAIMEDIDKGVQLKTFKDIEKYIANMDLPVMRNPNFDFDDGFQIMMGIVPRESFGLPPIRCSFIYSVGTRYVDRGKEVSELNLTYNVSKVDKVNVMEFQSGVIVKGDAKDMVSFDEISMLCDFQSLFISCRPKAFKLVKERIPFLESILNSCLPRVISPFKDPNASLCVYFDDRFKKIVLAINPAFVLQAAIMEYYMNSGAFRSLEDCYVYILAFFLAHEASHVARGHTLPKDGDYMIKDITHSLSNLFEDSYINSYLGRIFKGAMSQSSSSIVVPRAGYSNSVTTATGFNREDLYAGRLPRFFAVFKDVSRFVAGLNTEISKVMKMPMGRSSGSGGNFSLEEYGLHSSFIACFRCMDLDIFGGSSVLYTNTFNNVIGYSTIDVTDITNMTNIIGMKVRDNRTGRVGTVVGDDGQGGLRIQYPKQQVS